MDVDHDGDLDIVVGAANATNPARPPGASAPGATRTGAAAAKTRLWRNDGTGVFADITASSGVTGTGIVAIVPTDFDERRDVDLPLVPANAPLALFSNQRDGSFAKAARAAGLPAGAAWTTVAAGDLNKDGRTDFFFGRPSASGVLALSTGRMQFRAEPAPEGTAGARAAAIVDYDNDGLLDSVVCSGAGAACSAARAPAGGMSRPRRCPPGFDPGLPARGAGRALVAADIDNDGDTDLVFRGAAGPRVWRNDGGNKQPSLRVPLTGRVSNRSAIGTKVEVRAGSLASARDVGRDAGGGAADSCSGSERQAADVVRILWPSGILQSELLSTALPRLPVTEVDRKPSSCPFLFTWNGSGSSS